jgi:hypothetical protein
MEKIQFKMFHFLKRFFVAKKCGLFFGIFPAEISDIFNFFLHFLQFTFFRQRNRGGLGRVESSS